MQGCGWLAGLVSVIFVAVLMDSVAHSMAWYSRPWLVAPLYAAPALMAALATHHFLLPRQRKYFQFVDGVWSLEAVHFEVRASFHRS